MESLGVSDLFFFGFLFVLFRASWLFFKGSVGFFEDLFFWGFLGGLLGELRFEVSGAHEFDLVGHEL